VSNRLPALVGAAVLVLASAPAVSAAGPVNDKSSGAIVLGSIPASVAIDTSEATSSRTDPGYCHGPEMGPDPATVWFEYTATESGPLGATTFGSDYDTTLYVGTSDRGGFSQIACGDDSRTLQSAVRFDAVAGETYLFVVGTSPFDGGVGGNLVFNLDVGPPAQIVDVTLDPNGVLVRQTAVFHGTVSCTAPTTFQSAVVVELDQGEGSRAADYIGFADITDCPATELPFGIVVEQQVGHLRPGPVTLQVIFAACNDFECGNATIEQLAGTVSR
jgi:hypothetical protein